MGLVDMLFVFGQDRVSSLRSVQVGAHKLRGCAAETWGNGQPICHVTKPFNPVF